jgi:hypothetical protein
LETGIVIKGDERKNNRINEIIKQEKDIHNAYKSPTK